MTCRCGCDFCFVCLKEKKSRKWECTPYDFTCPIAPRQTIIPGSEPIVPSQSALPIIEEAIACDQTVTPSCENTVHATAQLVAEDQIALKTCVTKTIGNVQSCPVIRACPCCGTLLRNEKRRKHRACKCGCNFCFVCLMEDHFQSRDWDDLDHAIICFLAPRQTAIRSTVASASRPEDSLPAQRHSSLRTEQPTTLPRTTKSGSRCVIS